MSFNTISVIGLGYIGLPTAAAFASRGKNVVGVDINAQAVETINRGEIHIVEPDLDAVVKQAVQAGCLRAVTQPVAADAFLIAVPTPFKGEHQPDMAYVQAAALSLAPVLKKGDLVILESTSPVGATEQMAQWLAEARPDLAFPQQQAENPEVHIAYCPERVLPGQVMVELIKNDRVIGGMTPACSARASELYRIFLEGECVVTNARTAEMCKLTENSFRDVNIAFANELSLICAQQGINVWELIALANRHPRVNILQPGPGVGGHCIAVDPWFIVAQNPDLARLIRTAREVNDAKPHWVLNQVKAAVADCLTETGKRADELTIACFGLAFKPNIDDLRESPAMEVAHLIADWHSGATWVVEPNVKQIPTKLASEATLVSSEQALQQADVLVMLVDHRAFRAVPGEQVAQRWVVDTKGVWR
ncbi:MAG: UDP-N-acetyl-D-mannosamine dehydrogenase [Mixta calida]|jgi:UDP-N-acetyl-D-mannosaminuronic acid dehydrogenase|uniref:UDP-N-acetyl-D-mannosamine dehydrogenase n=1 Tax=Mixta calida TaxID=665913 RepID=A0ABN5HE29_9GAMM|nr:MULTISPECIES: UDP-N-acetyl-D-mannosamine dehydrogenase [Mixta]AIX75226.1 UDP-N-acetyl-D-mannosamine dehydrogenase [Pantoea sp. PSNIH2]MBS6058868.1 UDP-N-acetyl-D-mannosamine dehydrogenase [Pantoea sp.]POU44890.1 UDP-N-acetyl-D-mannosamine dehydrogenase [Pantoea sp. PSNIH5]POU63691.1 UDP-N-acetyl-D-mannosamine dehydrogenase [Pantoea sp. PSNIH4]POY66923.1 UDP-N-acetyl-D-mannosamine dehydrogenase [Pantoea sp. PSNIH3]HCW48140.1 UDP-N-acetyl-D-mannosamine dehydrogenase [Erwiniaceae bacterium]